MQIANEQAIMIDLTDKSEHAMSTSETAKTRADSELNLLTDYLSRRERLSGMLHYCGACRIQTPHAIIAGVESQRMTCLRCADFVLTPGGRFPLQV